MSDEDRSALVDYIAANPEAGVSLGGGLRKVRIARQGGGKSGGYRTIYVFGGVHRRNGTATGEPPRRRGRSTAPIAVTVDKVVRPFPSLHRLR